MINLLFSGLSGTASVTLVKAVNASGRIDQFLLAGKERMASRTNFDMKVVLHRRASLKRAAAGTDHGNFVVDRMYFWFHNYHFLRRI